MGHVKVLAYMLLKMKGKGEREWQLLKRYWLTTYPNYSQTAKSQI